MVPAESFRRFVAERLAAAAEEIFRVFQRTVAEYEEELDRQRRLLDVAWRPRVRLQRIELPRQHVCKEEEVLAEQRLWSREENPRVDHEEPEPPRVKEEPEELCSTLQLGLKREPDDFIVTTVSEGRRRGEVQTRDRNPEEAVDMPVISSVVSAANSELQPLSDDSAAAESRDQKGDGGAERGRHRQRSRRPADDAGDPTVLKPRPGKKSLTCDTCGKEFLLNSKLKRHLKTHTAEKAFLCKTCVRKTRFKRRLETHTCDKRHVCQTCGKKFLQRVLLSVHMKIHKGHKPHVCTACQKAFLRNQELINHMRIHTGEKPFICATCGKVFRTKGNLSTHVRTHTGEKPYRCEACAKDFTTSSLLYVHMRIHTGERPYRCDTCGKDFRARGRLDDHLRLHTGERPFVCPTCGKDFRQRGHLSAHVRTHTGEKPYVCEACGRSFSQSGHLFTHAKKFHPEPTRPPRGRVPFKSSPEAPSEKEFEEFDNL